MRKNFVMIKEYDKIIKTLISHHISYFELKGAQHPFNVRIKRDGYNFNVSYKYKDLSVTPPYGTDFPTLKGKKTLTLKELLEWHETAQKTVCDLYIGWDQTDLND
jgi:hypothetical protein